MGMGKHRKQSHLRRSAGVAAATAAVGAGTLLGGPSALAAPAAAPATPPAGPVVPNGAPQSRLEKSTDSTIRSSQAAPAVVPEMH